ncbi:sigma factor-like helix-turn-helix DNA-binding protein [Streptomyces sp. WMMC500]|uniref:sigma factor-like helix-turn-helix DNA-binding protein n=1 Tax=Streptomyces sp. WMMC500 TaxID=3015154 RepID=UPI00248AF521|nr:sigma factor-like helix-turn-helix DNA-binding protein [Streptomyces sp. WMMC500]WBB61646.1 sigma factor-like helix-turn-helix DNA-binding protein [Streptomyces sp. WMMC500]
MSGHDWPAERFRADRPRLRALAYRMLGSVPEADDAVRDARIRLNRPDGEVAHLGGWLTMSVARVSLNMLQSRRSRGEAPAGGADAAAALDPPDAADPQDESPPDDPEEEAAIADSVGLALLVVLDSLTPAERLAFVLHDMFAVPVEEIAAIVDRSPTAARQLADRARSRVQGAGPAVGPGEGCGGYEAACAGASDTSDLATAFLAASREGNFEALLAMLAPDIVLRTDAAAMRMSLEATLRGRNPITDVPEIRGADAVTRVFAGRTWNPTPALIDGAAGLVWVAQGRPHVAFCFATEKGRITAIDVRADLDGLGIVFE